MADRSIIIKLGITGQQQVTATLAQVGEKGEKSVGRIATAARSGADGLRMLAPILSVISAGALAQFAKSVVTSVGGLGELAEQLGINTQALQALQVSATQTGVGAEQLEAGLAKMARTVGEAAAGSKEAVETFNELGVGIQNADGSMRPLEEILQDVAVAISAVKDPATKARLEMEIFGKSGQRLTVLLGELARDGMQGTIDKAREIGTVVDDELIKNFDEAADKLEILKRQFVVAFAEMLAGLQRIASDPKLLAVIGALTGAGAGFVAGGPAGAAVGGLIGGMAAGTQPLTEIEKLSTELDAQTKRMSDATDRFNETKEKLQKALSSWGDNVLIKSLMTADLEAKLSIDREKLLAETEKFAALADRIKALRAQLSVAAADEDAAMDRRNAIGGGPREIAAGKITPPVKKTGGGVSEAEKFKKELDALQSRLDPVWASTQRYEAGVKMLDKALARAIIDQERYNELLADLESEYEGVESAGQRWNRMQSEAKQLIEELKTPLEQFGDELERIAELEKENLLTTEKANEARERARDRLRSQVDDQVDKTEDLKDVAHELGLTFTSAFEDAVVGGKKFSDVLKGLTQDIARLVLRKTVTEPGGNFLSGLLGGSGGLGGIFSSLFGGGGGLFSGTGYNPSSTFFGAFPFARGGIMTSHGPLPLRSYATGGIADRPQAAIFGEGSRPEAFVPLPDGRSIPVTMQGSSGPTINIDARGADAGVEQRIDRVLAKRMPEIMRLSAANVGRLADKGGSFSRTVGRRSGR